MFGRNLAQKKRQKGWKKWNQAKKKTKKPQPKPKKKKKASAFSFKKRQAYARFKK